MTVGAIPWDSDRDRGLPDSVALDGRADAGREVRPPERRRPEDTGDVRRYEALVARVSERVADFPDFGKVEALAGTGPGRLDDLWLTHAQMDPIAWLERLRMRRAADDLLRRPQAVDAVGAELGYADSPAFVRAFLARTGMAPRAYANLGATSSFTLRLPARYRRTEVIGYHGRDPRSPSERSEGDRIWKALATSEGPAVVEMTLAGGFVTVRVHADRSRSPETMAAIHATARRMLGLESDVEGFEGAHAAFAAPRRGLRVPLIPTGFDALCWAIVGQQINLTFASALRREVIELVGEPVGDMRVHPTPQAVAGLDVASLTARRFSRSKARYLLDAAAAVAGGDLDIEGLADRSAVGAEAALRARRGIGLWTARYVMMRVGFADAAPVGDSGLATALARLHALQARPDPEGAERLMSAYAPHRSLAAMHLWTSLKEDGA